MFLVRLKASVLTKSMLLYAVTLEEASAGEGEGRQEESRRLTGSDGRELVGVRGSNGLRRYA